MKITQRMLVLPVVFAGMMLAGGVADAQGRVCSNAILEGAYGFSVGSIVLPAGTPRAILGRLVFDGNGSFTNTLTFNDNGTILHLTDVGTYLVAADCTGKIFTNGSTKTIEIVVVDSGNEFYQIRTDPSSLIFLFNAAKKQFPGNN
jgi:hypothetical protein